MKEFLLKVRCNDCNVSIHDRFRNGLKSDSTQSKPRIIDDIKHGIAMTQLWKIYLYEFNLIGRNWLNQSVVEPERRARSSSEIKCLYPSQSKMVADSHLITWTGFIFLMLMIVIWFWLHRYRW